MLWQIQVWSYLFCRLTSLLLQRGDAFPWLGSWGGGTGVVCFSCSMQSCVSGFYKFSTFFLRHSALFPSSSPQYATLHLSFVGELVGAGGLYSAMFPVTFNVCKYYSNNLLWFSQTTFFWVLNVTKTHRTKWEDMACHRAAMSQTLLQKTFWRSLLPLGKSHGPLHIL